MVFIELIKITANTHSLRVVFYVPDWKNQYSSGTRISLLRMNSKRGGGGSGGVALELCDVNI